MKRLLLFPAMALTILAGCSDDDGDAPFENNIEIQATYVFLRNGASTVSFSGQTTRLLMAEEIIDKIMDPTASAQTLKDMYAHQEGNPDFTDPALNASGNNVRSKPLPRLIIFLPMPLTRP